MRPLFLLLPLLLTAPAWAATFVVDTTDDTVDAAAGDGFCADAAGACSLRAAVQEANANAEADQIDVPSGTFLLRLVGGDEDASASGDLDLTSDITISGLAAGSTIVKGKKDRVIHVLGGATVVIEDLTVTKGKLGTPKRFKAGESFNGGGILNDGGNLTVQRVIVEKNKSSDDAGGIGLDGGTLSLVDVLVSKNKAFDDAGGLDQDEGTLVLTNVTFEKNKAKDEGGALESEVGDLTATNVTFSKNKAAKGGAINGEQGSELFLTNLTFHKNKAKEGGGIRNEDGILIELTNSIFDRNKKENCLGVLTSLGGNLASDATCPLGQASDQNNLGAVGLGNLADNGGATPTHALDATSPAVDGGIQTGCPATDQRGQPRSDGACDAGAYEL